MTRFRLTTFRGYTLFLEVSALVVASAILFAAGWLTLDRMNDKYLSLRRDDAAKAHVALSRHLEDVSPKLERFAALSEAERLPATVALFSEFSDLYRLGSDLRVDRVYKAVPQSRVSPGYRFSAGELADLQEGTGNWQRYSDIVRGYEDDAPSVYLMVNRSGNRCLARLNPVYLQAFFTQYAQLSGNPLLLVAKNGFVILSSDPALASPNFHFNKWQDAGFHAGRLTAGNRRWVPLAAKAETLGARLVVLIPTEMLDSQRSLLFAFLCAFLAGLIVLVIVKNLQVSRLLLQPLGQIARNLSDLEVGRQLSADALVGSRFEELSNIYTRFRTMAEAIKLREQSLRASEARFKMVADSSPLAIYMSQATHEHKAVYVNPTFVKLFGYTIEDVPSPTELYQLVYPDESYRIQLVGEWLRRMRYSIETKTPTEPMEAIATCKDGSHKCIMWGFENLGELNWLFGLDLTERKQAEKLLKDANQKLEALSITDGLTGLANRRRFDEKLSEEVNRHSRGDAPLSLIMLDIDHFKLFNDRYGHVAGDDCLRQVAQAIGKSAARVADLAARYGGEEFACILPETGIESALVVANHIREGIHALNIRHESSKTADHVTVSLGVVSMMCTKTDTPTEIVNLADEMLYRAKSQGRDRIELHARQEAGESPAVAEAG